MRAATVVSLLVVTADIVDEHWHGPDLHQQDPDVRLAVALASEYLSAVVAGVDRQDEALARLTALAGQVRP